MGETN